MKMSLRTCREKCYGLHTTELGSVDVECLELLDLLLEDPDVVHEGHHPVRGHGRGVETRGRQQGRDVQRHVALGGVQHKQLRPHQPQQCYLGDKQGQYG